jgi:hypothetical protein
VGAKEEEGGRSWGHGRGEVGSREVGRWRPSQVGGGGRRRLGGGGGRSEGSAGGWAGEGRATGQGKEILALYHIGNPNPNRCWVMY